MSDNEGTEVNTESKKKRKRRESEPNAGAKRIQSQITVPTCEVVSETGWQLIKLGKLLVRFSEEGIDQPTESRRKKSLPTNFKRSPPNPSKIEPVGLGAIDNRWLEEEQLPE